MIADVLHAIFARNGILLVNRMSALSEFLLRPVRNSISPGTSGGLAEQRREAADPLEANSRSSYERQRPNRAR